MPNNPYLMADKSTGTGMDNPYTGTANPYMELGEPRTEFSEPAPKLAEDMMSQLVGLDRPKPAPLKETHPTLYAGAKTMLDMPSLVEKAAMSVVSGAIWSLPERAAEAGEWLSRKLFGEGRKGGATGIWTEEPQLHPYVEKAGRIAGSVITMSALGKVVAAPIITSVMKHPHMAPFARMIGWGAAGTGYRAAEQLLGEGELPTPKELIKYGGTLAGIEAVLSFFGWTGRLSIGLNRLSKIWTIPRKEALKIVVKEAKSRGMPIARYIYAKAGIQKALSAKGKASAKEFLNLIDDIPKQFYKKGTYPDLVKQLEKQSVEGRVKSLEAEMHKVVVTKYPWEKTKWTRKMGKNIRLTDPVSKEDKLYAALVKTKEKPAKIIAKPTKITRKVAEKQQLTKILTEDLPVWVRKTGDDIRLGKPVPKASIRRYQHYFATRPRMSTMIPYPTKVSKRTVKPVPVLGGGLPGKSIKKVPGKKISPPKGDSTVLLPNERIMAKGAAIKLKDGTMFAGQTHAVAYQKALNKGLEKQLDEGFSEGFITTSKRFITRDQAQVLYKASETNALLKKGIIDTGKPKKSTTLGFGPVGQLQNIYEKVMAGRVHKPLRKKLGDAIPHKHSPDAQIVMDALKKVRPLSRKQQELHSLERGKRLGEAIRLRGVTSGEHGYYAELAALKGKLEKVQFEPIRKLITQKNVNNMMNEIRDCPILSNWETYPARKALRELFYGKIPTPGGQVLLKDVFGGKFVDAMLAQRTLWKKIKDTGIMAINLPKAIKSSYDLSAALRQGIFMIRRHKQWMPAFRDMFKYFGNKGAYHESMLNIRRHRNYKLAREHKLALTDLGSLTTREEAFQSPWAEKIPGVGASARAYTGFLNQLRFDVFNDFVRKGKRLGLLDNPKYLKTAAKYINHATGRGHLLGLEGAATELNAGFFSPRLIMSRLQLVNPVFYVGLEKQVRKEALKDLFAFAGLSMTVAGLAKMAGCDIEVDSRNADFMKIRVGNKRYDILGGFQQIIRASAQFITGEIVSSTTGKTLTLGEGYKPMTRLGVAGRFLQYKLSPVASFAVTMLTGQATMGGKADIPTEIGRLFVPMAAQDMYEVYNDEGLSAIPLATPAFFGVGLQAYGGVSTYDLAGRDFKRLNTELTRLKTSMGFPSTSAYGQPLSNKEYKQFKTRAGKEIARSLENIMNADFYKKVNDDAKRHILDKVIDNTKEDVKRRMFKRYRLIQERATEIRKVTYKPILESRQLAKKQLKHIVGEK